MRPTNRGSLAIIAVFLTFFLSVQFFAAIPLSAQEYKGAPISISAQKLSLASFFRLIAEISKLNVVVHPSIHGDITLELHNVPWDQVLEIVLRERSLYHRREGSVLYIIPLAEVPRFFGNS